MEEVKTVLTSKTIWTQIVGVAAMVVAVWGIEMTPEQQAATVTTIITIMGVLTSIFRVKATAQLALTSEGVQEKKTQIAMARRGSGGSSYA